MITFSKKERLLINSFFSVSTLPDRGGATLRRSGYAKEREK